MDMATKATGDYEGTYPDGYSGTHWISLFDHIVDRQTELGIVIVDCPDEGCMCIDIVFADGSRITY